MSSPMIRTEPSMRPTTGAKHGSLMVHNDFEFTLPLDSEYKTTCLKIWKVTARPHMRAFWLSTLAFFMTFTATFAPAALMPVIREDLGLTKLQVGNSGVCAVVGAVAGRICMGAFLDVFGPRFGTAVIMLMFSPCVFLMSMVSDYGGFAAVRLFIGISLCTFVCCQQWVGSMFNVKIVGTANALAAGWGNMGGGATAIIMPAIQEGIEKSGVPLYESWRWAFFVPGALFLVTGVACLVFGQDAPTGDYRALKAAGELNTSKGSFKNLIKCGMLNYRTWVMFLNYGYCFGVELTVDNIIVTYLYDQFHMSLVTAGGLGALFGLMNLFSRASGGALSDLVAIRFGMRGRLWNLFTIQMLGGAFCLIMGYVDYSLTATIIVMIIFSIFCQQACGATFGVVPFISRRAYGVVSGCVGAGGNVGAIVTQVIFFAGSQYSPVMTTQKGLVWMGVMIMAVTCTLSLVHFPMWGSLFFPGNPNVTEEDYYLKEWTADEIAMGLHTGAMKFAMESRSQRGFKALESMKLAEGNNETPSPAEGSIAEPKKEATATA